MGLNDSSAENKQPVNDCSEVKEILTGLLTVFIPNYQGVRKDVCVLQTYGLTSQEYIPFLTRH